MASFLKPAILLFFALTLFANQTSHAFTGTAQGGSVIVRGFVSSSEEGLIIHDGEQGFLLLGADGFGFEGNLCEVVGDFTAVLGKAAIRVHSIRLLGEDFPEEDSIGFNNGRQTHETAHPGSFGPCHRIPGTAWAGVRSCFPLLPAWPTARAQTFNHTSS